MCSGAAPYNCPNAPPSLKNAKAVWDNADHYILLFGGQTTSGGGTLKNDSYRWSNGAWTKNAAGPSTLTVSTNASMSYDTADGYVVLFGGWSGVGVSYRAYTFKYLAGTWTLLTPGTAPTARAGAAMFDVPAFGGHGGYVVLFGGQKNGQWLSDTWEFAAGSWTNVTSTAGTPPAGRAYGSATYDTADHYGLLFGGAGGVGGATLFNDTWEWNPTTAQWVQLIASGSTTAGAGPVKQFSGTLSYVTAMSEVIQACGATGTFVAPANMNAGCPTYAWSGGTTTWTNISASVGIGTAGTTRPRAGYGATMADYATGSYAMRCCGETSASVVSNSSYALGNIPVVNTAESLGEVLLGGGTTFYANVTGGTSPYHFVWGSLPPGCLTANTSSLSCTPNAASAYAAWNVTVTTPDGLSVVASGLSLTVDAVSTVNASLNATKFAHSVDPTVFWGNKIYQPSSMADPSMITWWNGVGNINVLRLSPPCDSSNYSSGLTYTNSGGTVSTGFNWTQLKTFLAATGAKWLACVNGQLNNPAFAVAEMNYIEGTLGMHPYYWSIGNEPDNYIHWNKPFASWTTADASAPSALQWALEVQNYTAAMHAFDPTARIIGIQGGKPLNSGEGYWMYNISKIDGPNLTAVAEHNYPDGLGTGVVPASLFLGRANLTTEYSGFLGLQKNISLGCPTCKLPLFLDEFNSYVTGLSPTTWEAGYPQVPFDGAGVVNVLKASINQLTYYDFYDSQNFSLVNSSVSGGQPRPAYFLFSTLLSHLPIGTTLYDNVTPSVPMWNAYAVSSCSTLSCGTLLVNANTTVALNLALGNLAGDFGACGTIYSISEAPTGSYAQPMTSAKTCATLPASLLIPPMGVVLVTFATAAASLGPVVGLGTAGGSGWSSYVGTIEIVSIFLGLLVLVGVMFHEGERRKLGPRA